MILSLPYPPTANTYYRRVGAKTLISLKGRQYRKTIADLVGRVECLEGHLDVQIDVYPPDNRRRDLDNVLKSLLDSLQHAGCYKDDFQITSIAIQRLATSPPLGKVLVKIEMLS